MTEQQPHAHLHVPDDVVQGTYADFVSVWHSNDAFVLDFAVLAQQRHRRDRSATAIRHLVGTERGAARELTLPPSDLSAAQAAIATPRADKSGG